MFQFINKMSFLALLVLLIVVVEIRSLKDVGIVIVNIEMLATQSVFNIKILFL